MGTPPIVIIWYLNGTPPIKQHRGLLIQGWHYSTSYSRTSLLHQGEPHRRNSLWKIMGFRGSSCKAIQIVFDSAPSISSFALLCQGNLCSYIVVDCYPRWPFSSPVTKHILLYRYIYIYIWVIIQIITTECEWSVSDWCSSFVLNHLGVWLKTGQVPQKLKIHSHIPSFSPIKWREAREILSFSARPSPEHKPHTARSKSKRARLHRFPVAASRFLLAERLLWLGLMWPTNFPSNFELVEMNPEEKRK